MKSAMEREISHLLSQSDDIERSAKQRLKQALERYNSEIARVNDLRTEAENKGRLLSQSKLLEELPERVRHSPELCVTGKRKYSSSNAVLEGNKHNRHHIRAYKCDKCENWHGTKERHL